MNYYTFFTISASPSSLRFAPLARFARYVKNRVINDVAYNISASRSVTLRARDYIVVLRSGLSPFPPFVPPACVPSRSSPTLAGLHTVGGGRSVRSRPLALRCTPRLRLLLSRVLRPLFNGSGIAPLFKCSLRFALLPTKVGLAPPSYARSLPFLVSLGGGSFTRPPLAFLRGRARPPVRLNPATANINELIFSSANKRYFAVEVK